jgi:hypothetical protein
MQMEKATVLRDEWAANGDPPCSHPTIDKEYHLGSDTGDVICTTCGRVWPSNDPSRPDRNR